MFRKRRSSQKPDERFYAAFKRSFPDVGPGTSASTDEHMGSGSGPRPGPTHERSASISEAVIDSPTLSRPVDNVDDTSKDSDATPKPFTDQWRMMTPSIMDPNSYNFSVFANQTPGYYTPTSGGFNTFYHSSAAGDLHTPGMGMNTPLSIPHTMSALHGDNTMHHHFTNFNPQLLHQPQAFQDSFQPQNAHQAQQLFAPPEHFLQHQDSGYAGLDESPHKNTPTQTDMSNMQSAVPPMLQQYGHAMGPPGITLADKFRFQTTLHAPTAMIRHNDEIPITYLNKGQAYTISIFDTAPPPLAQTGVIPQYRTYVRVSFEDEQQRAKPGSCWQLWKEGRGSNEAHQRGGRLLAVEYVDPNQGGDEELRRSHIDLEKASFDGFAVTWRPSGRAGGGPDCSISVRFNFLSTDFSHSKGVKGIPVRFCAKTELVSPDVITASSESEVCYSKVKLFRDHGAERKLSNDIAHVKKSIDKLKQQIAQAESGMGGVGKRKRSGSMAAKDAAKSSAEEDLHVKLSSLQDMFSSTRPVSVLFLQGDPEDDPDLYPVKLPGGEEVKAVQRTETWDSRQSGSASPSSNVSPTPSSTSLTPKRKFSETQPAEDSDKAVIDEESLSPGPPMKIQKREHEASKNEILAVDIDSSYVPPVVQECVKPVACFYVRQKESPSPYYRAVYIHQRTVRDLVNAIANKFSIAPHRVSRVTHVDAKGLRIVVDEEVVRELHEGQDMVVEFTPLAGFVHEPLKHELHSPIISGAIDGDLIDADMDIELKDALEMWLNY